MKLRLVAVFVVGLGAALPSTPAAASARVYVKIGPPALVVETRGTAPSAKHVWIEGYHRWDGRAYVWVPSHWEAPPRHRTHWVSGRWAHDRHGWYWSEGHWR